MKRKGKNNLHMIETNWDELEVKIKAHRRKRMRWTIIILCICAAAAIVYYFAAKYKQYDSYHVTEEITRSDTSATHYISYQDGFLKYSNDGIAYVTVSNATIWNQSYEMENPMISTCQSYVAAADRQGEKIYILNKEELQGEIEVNMPISKIEVAAQGTVAVLMEENGTGYLSLFDKSGQQLAEGAIHVENSGTPMDIALSADGKKLGVSVVDVSEGTAKTTVIFYNFSTAGQKQIDNIVATFTYEDTIIPEIAYVNDSTMLAFADNAVYTFTGSETPKEGSHLEVTEEIQSVFYNENYFGLVYIDTSADNGRTVKVYDQKCKEKMSIGTGVSFDSIQFLDNDEIALYNNRECAIYTLGGRQKFKYEFEDDINGIYHESGFRQYIIMKSGETDRVCLKLF